MIAFAKRNLIIYFRDRAEVFFSVLGVLIVIGLYVLFLGDTWTDSLEGIPKAREMMDNWVMAGVLSITSMTTALGVLSAMVKDQADHVVKDFYASPVRRSHLTGGYFLGAYTVGALLSLVALLIAEIYIVFEGGALMSPVTMGKVVLLILLTTFMNTSIVLFMVSIFRSTNAYSTAGNVIGTLIGFLTGIYLPIGTLPSPVQWVIKLFPVSQAASLFRQVMMEDSMKAAFEGAPAETAAEIQEQLGVYFCYGDMKMSFAGSLIVIFVIGLVFFGFSCIRSGRAGRS